jgi:hypothetical protein
MKTDSEIKEFIDSKEAITKSELCVFIYGYSGGSVHNKKSSMLNKFWDYVLETKDWKKQREHKEKKLKLDKFPAFKKIYKNDKRIRELGSTSAIKLLKIIYNMHVSRSTFSKYKKML